MRRRVIAAGVAAAWSLACGGGPAAPPTGPEVEAAVHLSLPSDASALHLASTHGIDPLAQASFHTADGAAWASSQGFTLREPERFEALPAGLEGWWQRDPVAGSLVGERTHEADGHRHDWKIRVDPVDAGAVVWVSYVSPW